MLGCFEVWALAWSESAVLALFTEFSKSVQVLLNDIEAVMILTVIILNTEPCNGT